MEFTQELELKELVGILKDKGFEDMIEAFYEPTIFTMTGRLKLTALCRHLDLTQRQVLTRLDDMKRVLAGSDDLTAEQRGNYDIV